MKPPQPFSIRRRLKSFGNAFEGLRILILTQHNARIHALVGFLVLPLAGWLQIGRIKFILILWAVVTVWIAEAFNTTCEILLNIVSARYSTKVKRAKDVAAAAVLIAAAGACVTGVLILGPSLYQQVSAFVSSNRP